MPGADQHPTVPSEALVEEVEALRLELDALALSHRWFMVEVRVAYGLAIVLGSVALVLAVS